MNDTCRTTEISERLAHCIILVGSEILIEKYSKLFNVYHLCVSAEHEIYLQLNGATVDYPDQGTLCIVAENADHARSTLFENWCETHHLQLPVFQHGEALAGQLVKLGKRQRRAASIASDALFQLSELRSLHEELQNSYSGLRDHLYYNGYLLPKISFYNSPDPEGRTLNIECSRFEQRLPSELHSIFAFSLHVARGGLEVSAGDLVIELLSPDNEMFHLKWRVSYDRLMTGWNTFAFEHDGGFLQQSAIIVGHFETVFGSPPAISLGRPQLRSDRACLADLENVGHSLAMQVWTNLRGARSNATTTMQPIFLPEAYIGLRRVDVAIDTDLVVVDRSFAPVDSGFDVVVRDFAKQRVLVHPLSNEPTVAELVSVCVPGTIEIVAELITDHELAGEVEYAILAWDLSQTLSEATLKHQMSTAHWHRVPPKSFVTIRHFLNRPAATRLSIILMTRLPPGASSDYCWSHFRNVHLLGEFP